MLLQNEIKMLNLWIPSIYLHLFLHVYIQHLHMYSNVMQYYHLTKYVRNVSKKPYLLVLSQYLSNSIFICMYSYLTISIYIYIFYPKINAPLGDSWKKCTPALMDAIIFFVISFITLLSRYISYLAIGVGTV